MWISGYKTRSVFDRYNITSERDLREAASKLDTFQKDGRNQGTIEGLRLNWVCLLTYNVLLKLMKLAARGLNPQPSGSVV